MTQSQFLRMQAFSRTPGPEGNHVDQVIFEAGRLPAYSQHISDPKPVRYIGPRPGQAFNLHRLKVDHDAMVDACSTPAVRKGKMYQRKIRRDRPTLLTVIASHPMLSDEMADEASRDEIDIWIERNRIFLDVMFGADFQGMALHTDEPHVHLHGFVLPLSRSDADARMLIPGVREKREWTQDFLTNGCSKRVANAAGNKAYCSVMEELQDAYYNEVGHPCGLARFGDRKPRLTGTRYRQQQAQALRLEREQLDIQQEDLKRLAHALAIEQETFAQVRQDAEVERKALKAEHARLQKMSAQLATDVVSIVAGVVTGHTIFKDNSFGVEADLRSIAKQYAPQIGPAVAKVARVWHQLDAWTNQQEHAAQEAQDGPPRRAIETLGASIDANLQRHGLVKAARRARHDPSPF